MDTDPQAREELVRVDQIGVPAEDDDQAPVTLLLVGAGEATLRRLEAEDAVTVRIDGEPETQPADAPVEPPDVVLVSTRLPRNEALAAVARQSGSGTVVALVHTGGEALGADLLRAGARGLLAEGNEASARAFLSSSARDTGLLEIYDRQVGRSQVVGAGQNSKDSATGLPDGTAFEARLTEAQMAGDVPRIGFVRVLFLAPMTQRSSSAAMRLVRRRLALQFTPLAAAFGAELFAVGDTDFAVVSDELSPNRAEELGTALSRVAAGFAPWGRPLAVAMGHAGSEVALDPPSVRQLAERAVEVAAMEQRDAVVAAETLSLGASSTTELEAIMRLIDAVERHDPLGPGHSAAVAELAAAVAWELGYEGIPRAGIRLAAHLHDVGKVTLPVEAMFGDDFPEELEQAYRSHPVRGAELLRPLVGSEVASAVRAHHERWDGGGFPDGLAADNVPVAARIIAIVSDFLRLRAEHGSGEALERIARGAGSAYDPAIVEAATPLLATGVAPAWALAGTR